VNFLFLEGGGEAFGVILQGGEKKVFFRREGEGVFFGVWSGGGGGDGPLFCGCGGGGGVFFLFNFFFLFFFSCFSLFL